MGTRIRVGKVEWNPDLEGATGTIVGPFDNPLGEEYDSQMVVQLDEAHPSLMNVAEDPTRIYVEAGEFEVL